MRQTQEAKTYNESDTIPTMTTREGGNQITGRNIYKYSWQHNVNKKKRQEDINQGKSEK